MSKIISIGTAVPSYCHRQQDIMHFMQQVYAINEVDKRKMRFLYHQSGIENRYSVISDYSRPFQEWKFYPQTENLEPFPSLEKRMAVYEKHAPLLSVDAIRDAFSSLKKVPAVTHLITVSCTGMSAPGLDLHVMELMEFDKHVHRTSINFMGCYATIHALKIADLICKADENAVVVIVSAELCTLHFQREATMDNIASSLLFGDGAGAIVVAGNNHENEGLILKNFYSEIIPKGRRDMAWELSSTGFLMTLSGYVPDLIEEDFKAVVEKSLAKTNAGIHDVTHWCIHPGGKRILQAISKSLSLPDDNFKESYSVLRDYGNVSSASIVFVLKELMKNKNEVKNLFAAAFGPGLTVETFTAHW